MISDQSAQHLFLGMIILVSSPRLTFTSYADILISDSSLRGEMFSLLHRSLGDDLLPSAVVTERVTHADTLTDLCQVTSTCLQLACRNAELMTAYISLMDSKLNDSELFKVCGESPG